MQYLKYLFKSIHLLNIGLIVALALMAQYAILPLLKKMSTEMTMPTGKHISIGEEEKQASAQTSPFSDFMMIAEQNLFHPDRIIPSQKVSVPLPEIVLYGVLITDTMSVAFIEDRKTARSTPGRGKRQMQLKKGDTVSGFVLREVEPDRIILVKGDDKLVVLLDDKNKRKSAEKAASMASKEPASTLPSTSSPPAASPASATSSKAAASLTPAPTVAPQTPGTPQISRRQRIQQLLNEK
ncbi:MAG: hypothetical protein NT010_08285 [Proteobacteria bacterium]|nr:hypothetical protein [Pseudomonadota bacterium]